MINENRKGVDKKRRVLEAMISVRDQLQELKNILTEWFDAFDGLTAVGSLGSQALVAMLLHVNSPATTLVAWLRFNNHATRR